MYLLRYFVMVVKLKIPCQLGEWKTLWFDKTFSHTCVSHKQVKSLTFKSQAHPEVNSDDLPHI